MVIVKWRRRDGAEKVGADNKVFLRAKDLGVSKKKKAKSWKKKETKKMSYRLCNLRFETLLSLCG